MAIKPISHTNWITKQFRSLYYKLLDAQPTNPSATNQVSTQNHEENTIIPISNAKQPHLPAFLTDSLIPPTPLQKNIQQLIQALTVDGGSNTKNSSQESSTEMSVRSEMPTKSVAKESLLRPASEILSEKESPNRLGTKVPTESVEQRSATSENA